MRVATMMCKLGKLNADEIRQETCTLVEAVQSFAHVGDEQAFNVLPPVILHDGETVSTQQVWSSAKTASTGYMEGHSSLHGADLLLGAAILPIGSKPMPVLLFANHETKTVTASVYRVMFSSLEADLYRPRTKLSDIEVRWKGSDLATTHANLIAMLGTYMKSIGLSALPDFLLGAGEKKDFHLVRSGVIPFLHMRSAESEAEVDMIEKLMLSHAKIREAPLDLTSLKTQWQLFDKESTYQFVTEFNNSSLEEIISGLEKGVVANDENKDAGLDAYSTLSKQDPLPVCAACLMNLHKSETKLNVIRSTLADESAARDAFENQVLEAAQQNTAFHDLLNTSFRVFLIRNITSTSEGSSQAHAVCKSIFGQDDVGMALRDLNLGASSRPVQQCSNLVVELAKRVDARNCILVMEITASRQVRSLRLVNSCMNRVLDMDSAARLLDCPWVVPIGILPTSKEFARIFTLDSNGLTRDMLQVCDSIRSTYSCFFQNKLHSLPLQVDFKSIDERLSTFQTMVNSVNDVVSSWSNSASGNGAKGKKRVEDAAEAETDERASALKRMKSAAKNLLMSPAKT